MLKGVLKLLIILVLGVIMIGCTNTEGGTYARMNDAYNRKNNTENRSLILDTFIATTLYNHPEIIPSFGKSKTHSRTKTDINSMSNTVSNTNVSNFGTGSVTTSESRTTTHTRSKSKTKSVTTGFGISPNLDFYTK